MNDFHVLIFLTSLVYYSISPSSFDYTTLLKVFYVRKIFHNSFTHIRIINSYNQFILLLRKYEILGNMEKEEQ